MNIIAVIGLVIGLTVIVAIIAIWINVTIIKHIIEGRIHEERDVEFARQKRLAKIVSLLEALSQG